VYVGGGHRGHRKVRHCRTAPARRPEHPSGSSGGPSLSCTAQRARAVPVRVERLGWAKPRSRGGVLWRRAALYLPE
jgi:hypothetical protein